MNPNLGLNTNNYVNHNINMMNGTNDMMLNNAINNNFGMPNMNNIMNMNFMNNNMPYMNNMMGNNMEMFYMMNMNWMNNNMATQNTNMNNRMDNNKGMQNMNGDIFNNNIKKGNNEDINNNFQNRMMFNIYFKKPDSKTVVVNIYPEEKIKDLIQKYRNKTGTGDYCAYIYNGKRLDPNDEKTIKFELKDFSRILVVDLVQPSFDIRLLKSSQPCTKIYNGELKGLSKLCFLKEISSKLELEQLDKLPEKINFIISILKNREDINSKFINNNNMSEDIKKEIKEILKKIKGIDIVNFSKFLDEEINESHIQQMKELLNPHDLNEINDTKNRIGQYVEYIKLFEEEYEKSKRESIFEFSINSLIIMEREDLELFETERDKCPNRVDKILYHGTNEEPASCILTSFYKIGKCNQHGRGIYFTGLLDYCWFYGGINNRKNVNKIPEIKPEESFIMIANSIYYDKKGFRHVYDHKYNPKKNEINFAYADAKLDTLKNLDKTKFYGTEYVIQEFTQICPFISAKLIRNEYCVIWRDNNFSPKSQWNNQFDEIFKNFLKQRKKYIEQMAKFNIYPCQSSEEALNLIKRKKYNKIILISNVGKNDEGIKFVFEARKIIGNNVIVLFSALMGKHIEKIKKIKNALFSNDASFFEKYLDCFSGDENGIKNNIMNLKTELEKHYNVKFNFNEQFLFYPKFKVSGKYSELTF